MMEVPLLYGATAATFACFPISFDSEYSAVAYRASSCYADEIIISNLLESCGSSNTGSVCLNLSNTQGVLNGNCLSGSDGVYGLRGVVDKYVMHTNRNRT